MFNPGALLFVAHTLFLTLFSFNSVVTAQQYEGDVIKNELPTEKDSEIAFFKVHNSDGLTGTVTNYYGLNSTGGRIVPSEVKRAVINIHGLLRDPFTYITFMHDALAAVPLDAGVTMDNTAILVPYFPNGADKNLGYPWTDGLAAGYGSTSNALVWSDSDWASGADAQYPAYPVRVDHISSYDVLDQMVQYFDNKTIFPNMNQIVVSGHSLGAQTVQRYAAVGNVLKTKTPVSYYVANPDTLLWFTEDRPLPINNCSTYDNWRLGLSNYTNRYGAALIAKGRNATFTRYTSRQIAYARGTQDFGDDSSECGAFTSGANRGERFFNFMNTFTPTCSGVFGSCSTIDYVPTSHQAEVMMASAAGQARLFLDNFNGTKEMAFDFGYPRLQPKDDPYPNPALEDTSPITPVYAGGMTSDGCWTDNSTSPTLSFTAWTDRENTTIELCTSACVAQGFTVAGMEFANNCYCDDAIGSASLKQAEGVCGSTCAGNSSEICGALNRLSIYSKGTPAQLSGPPKQPAQVGSYSFLQCQVDDTTHRALNGPTETQASMSLESCATFCAGYTFFGTEYGNECFCGNSLASTSSVGSVSSCDMPCSANGAEICGASFRLSVYQMNITCIDGQGDGYNFTAATGGTYQIACNTDRYGGDLTYSSQDSINACIDACDATAGCIDVSWDADETCYLKSSLPGSFTQSGVINARKLSG